MKKFIIPVTLIIALFITVGGFALKELRDRQPTEVIYIVDDKVLEYLEELDFGGLINTVNKLRNQRDKMLDSLRKIESEYDWIEDELELIRQYYFTNGEELNMCTDIDDDETYVREECFYDMDGVIDVISEFYKFYMIDDRGYVIIFDNSVDMFYLYDYDGTPRSAIPTEKWIVEDHSGIGGRYPIRVIQKERAINVWENVYMDSMIKAYLENKEE